ncbi:MAG TPA: peptide chain release factor N(5)-glutamine methyltransferase [Verrucomicrobiae bacterium]|nr:peptide chain release factor N(5)-glutamine methyltransferase [Verrucomicrobiae bacterium]
MNANLPPKASKIVVNQWLAEATAALQVAGITSARLDAELLLANELDVNRSWLLAHNTEQVTVSSILYTQLARRVQREPLAYITGHKEFYGFDFQVTPAVLIPRPETEALVDFVKNLQPEGAIVDVGTGSGCIAVSLALTCPQAVVHAIDSSQEALEIATKNAQQLQAAITFHRSNLLSNYRGPTPHIIVANLPYVDPSWERSPETKFEPKTALFADQNGLQLMFALLHQAAELLPLGGSIILEADPRQFPALQEEATNLGFSLLHADGFMIAFQR